GAFPGLSEITTACANAMRPKVPDTPMTHAAYTSQRPTAHINCIGPQWRTSCQAVTVHRRGEGPARQNMRVFDQKKAGDARGPTRTSGEPGARVLGRRRDGWTVVLAVSVAALGASCSRTGFGDLASVRGGLPDDR